MNGPGAPLRRGAAVLRRDGQHTGKITRRRTSTLLIQLRAETKEGKR
jgi:hypothetical protein